MDVSVVLRLVDQLSGPAKKTADALRDIVNITKQLKGAGGLDGIGRSLNSAVSATSKLRSEIRSLVSDMQRLSGASRNAMVGGRGNSWANQQVAAWRQVIQVQQQVIANQRRIAMGGGGFGGRGGHGNSLAPMVGYHPMQHGLLEVGKAGTDYSRQLTIARMNTRSVEEIAEMQKVATEVSRLVPMTSQAEVLKQINEMVPAFGDVKHALEFAVNFARSDALVAMMLGSRQEGQSQQLAKALEGVGAMKDHDRAVKLIDMWSQSIVASGGRMTPQNLALATTYMRASKFGANDEFLGRVLPSLIVQSQRPSTVGQELASLSGYIVGQRFPKDIIPEWIKAGLIDESKVRKDKFGASKKSLEPGAISGSDEYMRNPFEWVQKYVVPILEKEGILGDNEATAKRISQLFPLRTAADIVTEMVSMRDIIRKDVELYRRVQDPKSALDIAKGGDWGTAAANFKAAFENLANAFTGPLVEPAIAVMNRVAEAMQAIAGSLSGVDPTVLGVIGGGGIVAALAGITGLLSSPFFRMLALGGIGFAAGGPSGALLGGLLANSLTNLGAAASAALAPLETLAGLLARAFAPVAAVVGAAGAIKGIYDINQGNEGLTGAERLNKTRGETLLDRRRRMFNAGREMMGVPLIGQVPYLENPFQPFNQGVQGGVAPWQQGFLGTVGSFNGVWEQKGAEAGSSWGSAFVNAVRGALQSIGAISVPMPALPRPNIAPQPQSAPGGGGGGAEQRSASISFGDIHVHGSGDARRTADLVHQRMAEAIDRALADGSYAGSLA
jgi:hypothetical protein